MTTPYEQLIAATAGRPLAFDVVAAAQGSAALPTVKGYVNLNRSCGHAHTLTNTNRLPIDLRYTVDGSAESGSIHLDAASSTKLRISSNGRIRLYQAGVLVYVADTPPGCA